MAIFKSKLFWIAVIGIVIACGFYLKPNKWEAYYQRKLGNPPHAVVVQAAGLITQGNEAPTAIDFGSGVGNETAFLLKQGFRVIAIDSQPIAFKMLRSRDDIEVYPDRLQMIESRFESVDWKERPQVNLFVAALALPFCKPVAFQGIFAEIKSHIKPGGIFAGHFFDPDYQGFSEKDRQAMTFLTKDQVLDLFSGCEILHFKETKEPGKSGTGADIVSHIYEVIARKKEFEHMKKTAIDLQEIKLIGLSIRTNNANEMDPEKSKIGALVQRYHQEAIAKKIPNRKNPGVTLCAYTNYESDFKGDYTFFIGEEVSDLITVSTDLKSLTIPVQNYSKFTTESGPMPDVVINAWQKIWKMSDRDFGGKRAYLADFEVYDARASDLKQTVMDIYIGLEN